MCNGSPEKRERKKYIFRKLNRLNANKAVKVEEKRREERKRENDIENGETCCDE